MSDASARDHALRIGAKLALPQMARTWSEREFRRNQWRLVTIMLVVYAGFCGLILFGLVTDAGGESRYVLAISAPVMLGGGLLLGGVGVWRARRWPDYRDHGITIGVDSDAVTVIWQTQTWRIPYDDIRYRPHWVSMRGAIDFADVTLTTPIGDQPLVNLWYQNGRKTAAVIVAAHDRWYLLERRG